MAKVLTGKRYAQAAFELAVEKEEPDSWQAGLEKLAALVRDQELMMFLENPRNPFAAKRERIQDRLGDVNPLARNLALLLVTKGKLSLAEEILREYHQRLCAHRGIHHAEVATAFPLSEPDRELMTRSLGEMLGRQVVVQNRVAPSLVGGFRARIGDLLIDASVAYKLQNLKNQIVEKGW